MQASGSFGGNIGPFTDPGTGQTVHGTVHGTFVVQAMAQIDINAALPDASRAIVAAINHVVGQKLAANQVALATVQQSLPYFQQEIGQAAGLDRMGLQLVQLNAMTQIQSPAPAVAPYAGPMPATPMQAAASALGQAAADRLDPRNYEVRANVNVGGFKIKANSKDGVDTEGIKNQVVDKAKSTVIWWGIGCAVVALVVLGLAALGGYIWWTARSSMSGAATPGGEGEAATWDGKSTFSCGGVEHKKLKGVTANLPSGTAITADSNCRLELEDVHITAPVCIEARSNAKVTVQGGTFNCSQNSAKALGNAQISFSGSTVTGKPSTTGNGKVTGP